jgi:hypothetical protein
MLFIACVLLLDRLKIKFTRNIIHNAQQFLKFGTMEKLMEANIWT